MESRSCLHDSLTAFAKACPEHLVLRDHVDPSQPYKYYVRGKGCTLGVLFEDSINVYFEWLTEHGSWVSYGPEIRYKAWSKRELARLVAGGVWEVETDAPVYLAA